MQDENPRRLPEITMGALYVEEIDDWSEEDENNNYRIDPDEIEISKHSTNLESMKMEEENDRTRWSQLVEPALHFKQKPRET